MLLWIWIMLCMSKMIRVFKFSVECAVIMVTSQNWEGRGGHDTKMIVEKKYISPWNGFQPSLEATSHFHFCPSDCILSSCLPSILKWNLTGTFGHSSSFWSSLLFPPLLPLAIVRACILFSCRSSYYASLLTLLFERQNLSKLFRTLFW